MMQVFRRGTILAGAALALVLAGQSVAAPVPFVGTLTLDFTGSATPPAPPFVTSVAGAGIININPGTGILTPINAVSIPAFAFTGAAPTAFTFPFGFQVFPFQGLHNAPILLAAGGTCSAGHPNVKCPGGGLAGFGPLTGTLGLFPFVGSLFPIGGGSTGGISTAGFLSGAGWTTGPVTAVSASTGVGPVGPPLATTGSVGPTTLSLVSPIAFNLPLFCAGCRTHGFAKISMTLTLSCGDGLISMGETCDDGGVAGGDGCDASCAVEPGYVCRGAPSVCVPAVGVSAKKLIVIDKLAAASKAKAVYVAKDPAVTKGAGLDPADISVTFDVTYDGETGHFAIPAGVSNGTEGWVANKEKVAKYVNKSAPGGSTTAKVAVIKPAKLLKLVAKERGDADKLDILGAGAPAGSVFTAYCVVNGGVTTCHCTEFAGCAYKSIAAGTGAKLVCKSPNAADPTCTAVP
jgi:cysteine-rich repeat protein